MAALRSTTYLKDQIKLISRQKEEAQRQIDKLQLKQSELQHFQKFMEKVKTEMEVEKKMNVEDIEKLLLLNPREFSE